MILHDLKSLTGICCRETTGNGMIVTNVLAMDGRGAFQLNDGWGIDYDSKCLCSPDNVGVDFYINPA